MEDQHKLPTSPELNSTYIYDQTIIDSLQKLSIDENYIQNHILKNNNDYGDEEDDDYFPMNPSGSVLVRADKPYNKASKIQVANYNLQKENFVKQTPESRVHFHEKKTVFVYNYEDVFPTPEETPFSKASTNYPDSLKMDKRGSRIGNDNKVLVVKLPVTEGRETISDIDYFENDDVCIPMLSIGTVQKEEIGEENVEQLTENYQQNKILEEKTSLQETAREIFEKNNIDEEVASTPRNNSGVVIKITSADSFDSEFSTDTSNQEEIEEQGNIILERKNLNDESKIKIGLSDSEESKNVVTEELNKQSKYTKKPSKKQTLNSFNIFKPKVFEKNKNPKQNDYKRVSLNKTEAKNGIKLSKKSKSVEIDLSSSCSSNCSTHVNIERPKSCVEKSNLEKKRTRPLTAPTQRTCCQWSQPRLPDYNGLRSEYGLSAEQLKERKQ
uniref:Uncharacterized protein n=1 Tax=Clastoptera arizonana TaxID=38151 RepID=A0A1B6DEL4_9HEMI